MKQLRLFILAASLLPTFAIIWARLDEARTHAELVELRIAVQRDIALHTVDGTNQWLSAHSGHPLAPQVSRLLRPDLRTQLLGVHGLDVILRAIE